MTIIILSAYDYSEIEAEAREAGVDEFIAKSLFRSRLTATLKNIIEGKSNKEANIETANTDHSNDCQCICRRCCNGEKCRNEGAYCKTLGDESFVRDHAEISVI